MANASIASEASGRPKYGSMSRDRTWALRWSYFFLVLFAIFCLYAGSGYGVYVWKRMKGRPVSVIATSTDEPEEEGLHR
jgi:hypothetical protein